MLGAAIPKVITDRSIDHAYIYGYVTDDDYKKYYMDPTRTFVPCWVSPNNEFGDVVARYERELVVDRKNLMIHNINMATKLLEE